jgi:hypothetical protein
MRKIIDAELSALVAEAKGVDQDSEDAPVAGLGLS